MNPDPREPLRLLWQSLSLTWQILAVAVPLLALMAGWLGAVTIGPGARVAQLERRADRVEDVLLLLSAPRCTDGSINQPELGVTLRRRLANYCEVVLTSGKLPPYPEGSDR